MVPLRGALSNVRQVLDGPEPRPEQEAARTPEIAEKLRALAGELDHRLAITEYRWGEREAEGRIGGPLDPEYDANYRVILDLCGDVFTDLEQSSATDWQRAATAALAVNGAVMVVLFAASGIALRFWIKRA